MKQAFSLLVPAALAFTGCAPGSLSGEVDGKAVPGVASAVFYEADVQGVGVLYVALSTADNLCERMTAYNEAVKEADEAYADDLRAATDPDAAAAAMKKHTEKLGELERAHMPQDYWTASLLLEEDAVGDLLGEESELDDDGVLGFTVTHHEDYVFPEQYEDAGDIELDNVVGYGAIEGTLTLSGYDRKNTLSGAGSAKLVDADEGDVGEVTFSFNATFCELEE